MWGCRPDGDKVFRNAKDRAVRSNCLRNLRRLKNSKSWNRLGLKYSRSGYLFQYSLRPVDGPRQLSRYCDLLRDGRSADQIPGGGGQDFPHPSSPALEPTRPPVPCLFPGAKEAGLGINNPPPSRAEVEEIGEQCTYSTSGLSWPVFFFGLRITLLAVFCILMSVCKSRVAPQADAKEIRGRVLASLGLRLKQHRQFLTLNRNSYYARS